MAELIIDRNYYNKLDIEGFSKMMSSPSYSYKFYWLEAIVQLISANRTEVTYDEIINKMIVNAWFPVQEYHIHLSGIYGEGEVKDNLEKAVSRLFKLSDLPSNADEIQIINKLNEFSDDKELHFYKTELTKNVPYKALSGFANKGTEKIDLNSSAGRMIAYYNRLSGSEILLPYTFNDEKSLKKVVSFNDGWIQMIQDNTVSILGWIKYENTTFLADVEAKEASSGMSLVFSMAPGYRDLYKYYLMLLRGLSITGDVFNISVKDLALLYEYWCFIKLNSMMKDRYELISQDIVKVQGNGLFVSLVKGSSSKVKYRNSENGEVITLSYNPKSGQVPTVAQKPDNVLSLEKKTVNQVGKKVKYEYVFDAKYRVNPALEGSDYYNTISHTPGPETDDINTMHRYRDAIVYHNGADPYERTMFGAYVLFPYANKEEYRNHKFFESIEKVNIGGLPFLPSETSMVQDMLDALIADSPDSAFERATLPRGIEDKLANQGSQ